MWPKFKRFIRLIAPFVTLATILFFILMLPGKVREVGKNVPWWVEHLPSNVTALASFCALLILWILWIDVRPAVAGWWSRKQYSREKIERLRLATRRLRDVAWGVLPGDAARERIQEFADAADDFAREPVIGDLVRRIDAGTSRLAIMAAFPGVGPQAPPAELHHRLLNDTMRAMDELMAATDRDVIHEPERPA